jgi:hypothetical protein
MKPAMGTVTLAGIKLEHKQKGEQKLPFLHASVSSIESIVGRISG